MLSKSTVGWTSLLSFTIIAVAWITGFMSRLYAVIRFESIIHEFDPWFNYRATHYMVERGFYNFHNWFDEKAWYPLGRIVGGTVYPGLMLTSGAIHYFLSFLNIPIHIRDVCVFLAPIFSGLTAIASYLLTKELWNEGAGLFSAVFIAIVPGYISRSVAGSYDNEGIAIFALIFTFYLWIKAVKTGSLFWGCCTALSYFYMVSAWGGYVFIINLIPLHTFCLLIMGRFSSRLYVAYCSFYVLGTIMSMQIPFVGFQPVFTSEHMASFGTFALINLLAFEKYLSRFISRRFLVVAVAALSFLSFALLVLLTFIGVVSPWSGRFYSLWDTGYAKIHIPIIASVSEHQPTTWSSFFFDLHILSLAFPFGAWICLQQFNDERLFIVLYAVLASYFAGVMVRLMLTLTPVVCILSGITFSEIFSLYVSVPADSPQSDQKEESSHNAPNDTQLHERTRKSDESKKKKESTVKGDPLNLSVRALVCVVLFMTLVMFSAHCSWVTSNAYSSPSIVLASHRQDGTRDILDDFREAYNWLRHNTAEKARVMAWWDYGYQIAGMGNKTTLVDNNTWNNSHIALVGKAMSSNESAAYEIMRSLDVDYVLVIFGGVIGYSGDDINKFLWMVRIAEGEHPNDIKESEYFTPQGEFRVDAGGSPILLNCLMYKLSYYRFAELKLDMRMAPGFDRTRNVEIGNKNIKLEHLEEAYTTEHWLVRIYKVKDLVNREKSGPQVSKKRIRYRSSRKTKKNKSGSIKVTKTIVHGKKSTIRK